MTRRAPAVEIADAVYAAAREREVALRGLHAALVKRVTELLRQVGDRDQVELVVLGALDLDGAGFAPYRSLSWGTYEYVRDQLRVPDGCWGWLRWVQGLQPGKLRESAAYWFDAYGDALAAVADAEAERALGMLERLRGNGEASWD